MCLSICPLHWRLEIKPNVLHSRSIFIQPYFSWLWVGSLVKCHGSWSMRGAGDFCPPRQTCLGFLIGQITLSGAINLLLAVNPLYIYKKTILLPKCKSGQKSGRGWWVIRLGVELLSNKWVMQAGRQTRPTTGWLPTQKRPLELSRLICYFCELRRCVQWENDPRALPNKYLSGLVRHGALLIRYGDGKMSVLRNSEAVAHSLTHFSVTNDATCCVCKRERRREILFWSAPRALSRDGNAKCVQITC